MKFSRVFALAVTAFLALVFFSELRAPKRFRWEPTFGHADRQPFGCYVVDSVLSASLPRGYRVCSKTLYQLQQQLSSPHGIIVIAEQANLCPTDVRAALRLAARGHHLLVASSYVGPALEDSLQCHGGWSAPAYDLLQYVRAGNGRDTIVFHVRSGDSLQTSYTYYYYGALLTRELLLMRDSSRCRMLSGPPSSLPGDSLQRAYAVGCDVGRGSITWVSTPLVMTNYGMLDGRNYEYVFRLLSQLHGLPTIRTEAYGPAVQQARQTPLRYLLSQRPLRWALYLALFTLLLALAFGCRRRQRVIPVVRPPRNELLEFVKIMGTLKHRQKSKRQTTLNNRTTDLTDETDSL